MFGRNIKMQFKELENGDEFLYNDLWYRKHRRWASEQFNAGLWEPDAKVREDNDTFICVPEDAPIYPVKKLCQNSSAGSHRTPIAIIKETSKRFRVRLLKDTRLLRSNKSGKKGQEILVPKYAIAE